MSTPNQQPLRKTPPSLSALTARFLSDPHRDFATTVACDPNGVELHEAPSGFRTETRTTWSEALVAAQLGAGPLPAIPAPASWGGVCRGLPTRFAVPMGVGNYPQLLADPAPLFSETDLSRLLRPTSPADKRPESSPLRLSEQAKKSHPELAVLVAAAGHRLSGDLASCENVLRESEPAFTGRWRSVWENEHAIVHWESGRFEAAEAAWNRLPGGLLKAYNLGLSGLFRNHPESAIPQLRTACEQLSDSSGWKHLASLYLARLA